MTSSELKKTIENNTATLNGCFILLYKDNDFLARQYARGIVDRSKLECIYCASIDDIPIDVVDIFGDDSSKIMYILSYEEFDSTDVRLLSKNLIVIAKKITKEAKEKFKSAIIELPALDEWSIKDYIFSVTNAEEKNVEDMYALCGGDIYRIDNELNKIKVFDENYRNILLERMISDKSFGDVSKYSILNLSNAIITKKTDEVARMMQEIESMDVSVFALITLLYNGFKNVVAIQLSRNPTPENTGIKSGQFYAIKKNNIGYYNKDSLYAIIKFLSGVDKMIKSGKLPIEISIDYIVYNILSM